MCETKYCADCERTLPVTEFTSDKRKRDGLCCYCRKCMGARNKRYKSKSPEKIKEINKAYREANKIQLLIYSLLKYHANKETHNKNTREYYRKNRESMIAYQVEYREKNSDRLVEYRKKRFPQIRARQYAYNVVRDRKLAQRSFPHERDAVVAVYRNCPEGHHVDHIVPISHPLVCGLHVVANLQYLPARENMKKSNHFTIE